MSRQKRTVRCRPWDGIGRQLDVTLRFGPPQGLQQRANLLPADGRIDERSEARLVAATLEAYEAATASFDSGTSSQRSPVTDSNSAPSLVPIASGEKLCS